MLQQVLCGHVKVQMLVIYKWMHELTSYVLYALEHDNVTQQQQNQQQNDAKHDLNNNNIKTNIIHKITTMLFHFLSYFLNFIFSYFLKFLFACILISYSILHVDWQYFRK